MGSRKGRNKENIESIMKRETRGLMMIVNGIERSVYEENTRTEYNAVKESAERDVMALFSNLPSTPLTHGEKYIIPASAR